jgi:hypothetical protein
MKNFIPLILICISTISLHAQVSKTLVMDTAGKLESKLTATELNTITNLTVKGKINELDFLTMRVKMPALVSIEIGEANVIESTRNGYVYPANEIPVNALSGNVKIRAIKLPSSAISIGVNAFRNCTGLSSFTNAISVTTIQHEAFYNCKSLKTVDIPAKVSTIQYEAFYLCDSLTLVNISNSLVRYERNCFNPTASFTVDPSNLFFSAQDGILYNKNKTTLFQCPSSKSGNFSIASSVVTIGADAFRQCGKITGITFSPALDSIKDYAFIGCTGLTKLNFPSSLRYIGNNTFYSCSNLKSVILSNSLETIGESAFEKCAMLDSIFISSSVKTISSEAFRYCTSLKAIGFSGSSELNKIGDLAFHGCTALVSANIPNSVKNMGGAAFQDCVNLKNVHLPTSLSLIPYGLFIGCEKLAAIDIPNSVTKIGESAFMGCYALSAISLPASVDTIAYRAFAGCTGLKSANIPKSVKFIGPEAYYNCKALFVIYVFPQIPVDLSSSDNVFGGFSKSKCNLMVPTVSKSQYKTANQWKDFTLIGALDVLVSELKSEGTSVPAFHNMIFDYSIILAPGTKIPMITANNLYPNSTIKIIQVTELPGAVTIEVTGIDNTTKQTYTVYMAYANENSNIVTMKSSLKTGNNLWVILNGTQGQILVDYGDGILKASTLTSNSVFNPTFSQLSATAPLDNPIIKVYAKSINILFVTALNQVTDLDVIKDPGLISLLCSDNKITTLDVSRNSALLSLECNNNKITSLKCSAKNTALNEIYCTGNLLSACGLDSLFQSLPLRSTENKGTLYVGDNPGTLTGKTEIAISKFWTTDLTGDGSGCSFSGIDESELVDLVLYPNPCNGICFLQIPAGHQLKSISIVGSSGQIIRSFNVQANETLSTFDLSDLSNGIYLLRCTNSNGFVCRKFVKTKAN